MDRDRGDEQQHDDGDRRRAEDLCGRCLVAAEQRDHDAHRSDGQRHVGDRGEPLMPEMLGARFGGAAAEHASERCADMGGLGHYPIPIVSMMKIHSTRVMAIEPTRLAAASHSRSFGPKPRPVSQMRWRMPPSMWWMTLKV